MTAWPAAKPAAAMTPAELSATLDRLAPSQLRILASAFAGASPAQFDAAMALAARTSPPEKFAGIGVNRL